MKFKHLLTAILVATPLLFSCKPEENMGAARIEVNPMELSFTQGESSQNVTLVATRDWIVETQPDWVGVSVTSGVASTKEQTISISVTANSGFDRSGDVVFSTGFMKKAVTIKQTGSQGELKTGSGTLDDPYTVAGVIAYVESLGKDVNSPVQVYIKGKVASFKEDETFSKTGSYGNATFYISDDGETGVTFYCYRIKYLGNKAFKAGQTDIALKDDVIICGNVVNYRGNTPETAQNTAYLYSLNGKTDGGTDPVTPGVPSGSGSQADPYNVAAAVQAVKGLTWTSTTSFDKVGPYYVKGKVSAIDQDYTYNVSDGRIYGNARFSISDDGKSSGSEQFTLYNLNYLGDTKFKAGQTDIKVGDDVIIYAELMNYRNDTPENSGGYLYSLNGVTGQDQPGETVTGTVSQIIGEADGTSVIIPESTVMAISKQGIVVSDGTANVYLYFDAKNNETVPSVAIGDKVKVEAQKDTYGGVPELKAPKVTAISSGAAVSYPEPKDLNSLAASYNSAVTEFVKMTGKLIISGNYVNIEIDGVDPNTKMGSVSAPLDALGAASFDGKKVTVKGYFSGITGSGKYINVVATEIAPADPNAKYCSVSPDTISAKADQTSATFSISSNAAWEATSDNADFTLSPASGTGDATVTVSFAANGTDAAKVAHITVACAEAGVNATVTITQAKPSSGEALTISIDFTKEDANLPQGSANGKQDGTYTVDGYTFTLHAADKYYQGKVSNSEVYYLLIGKKDSYIQFPVVDGKALTKVQFLTGSGASENVVGDIAKADGTRLYINDEKFKKGATYDWTVPGEVGAAYRFVVTNAYNAQFQTLTLIYE
ncbi:MAG: BACON domain-containing protein [Bacteroidales bacterium]|nr:BACON domain-containing protein [Bacteroidales bacterium]